MDENAELACGKELPADIKDPACNQNEEGCSMRTTWLWVYGISTIILDDHVVVPRPSKPHWPSGVLLGRDLLRLNEKN